VVENTRRCGYAAADGTAFVARGPTPIRGRSDPIDIYTLTL